jgi:hypothetical protein
MAAGVDAPRPIRADRRPEDEPVRNRAVIGAVGPGEPTAADQTAIDTDRIGPFDRDRLFWRRAGRERVAKRDHAGIENAARRGERLLGLEHDGELGDIEPADKDQRARAKLGGMSRGMAKGVSRLAQHDEPVRRRQVEPAPDLPCPLRPRHPRYEPYA